MTTSVGLRHRGRMRAMMRLGVAVTGVLVAGFLVAGLMAAAPGTAPKRFTVVEATISGMRSALESKQVTSRELVLQSLVRIATYEDKLHAAITINPHALDEADERDRERAAGKVRGPLHGIP